MGAWFDAQSNGRSQRTVIGKVVKWSDFRFRKFTLAAEGEDQKVERSRKISVTQIQAKS